ncbi:MAG: serine hydrolase [Eubacteriales bacterium]|nr:serine hydrolase [Eubacteriales bacterium]
MPISSNLRRISPSRVGLRSDSVFHFLDAARTAGIELHGLMIAVDGAVAAEGWWQPYSPCTLHSCYSGTKTFTAAAIGFAVAEGLLRTQDRFLHFFPEQEAPELSEDARLLTVHHLLCMASGQTDEIDLTQTDDPVRTFLRANFTSTPGETFDYNSMASHMLALLLFRLTGQTLPEYLSSRLFDPLGIRAFRWDRTPQGLPMGGWGLHLRTEDYLKMGLLILQHGVWEGRQVLPDGWAELASAFQMDNATPGAAPEWAQGYGYQMWRCQAPVKARLSGSFGQHVLICPALNAVVAIQACTDRKVQLLDLVREKLMPGFTGRPLQNQKEDRELRERFARLTLGEEDRVARSGMEKRLDRIHIVFSPNTNSLFPPSQRDMAFVRNAGLETFDFEFYEESCTLFYREGGVERMLPIGLDGRFRSCELPLPYAPNPVLSLGFWENDDFCFLIRSIEEPHSLSLRLSLKGNEVTLTARDPLKGKNVEITNGRACLRP